jgi:uncharacterized protein
MGSTSEINRRGFMKTAAMSAAALAFSRNLQGDPPQTPVLDAAAHGGRLSNHEVVPWRVLPFPNPQVRLLDGIFKQEMEFNQAYLHRLPNDRLAHMFRLTAGLPSQAEPLGGWEKPDCELRGHFTGGHFLSACALLAASAGDDELRKQADELVAALAQCQKQHGNGYLSAFPESFFDRLRDGKPVWAPFYTLHKIMAGHLDMYTHCANEQALQTLEGMAGWVDRWVEPLSDDHMQRVLEVEQGGMLEVLCNLYAVTGKEQYLRTASRFDHHAVFDPLAQYRDELTGLHANTNIPKIIGAARQYELTGNRRYHDIASYFWHEVTARRTYVTGGTSYDEHWVGHAGELGKETGHNMEECCCGYNMLKLTRHLFGLTADPRTMDYYERTLFNSRLGTQNPQGLKSYFYPLGRGWWKYYNSPLDSFWCCTGTGAEEFSKFNNTIYFHDDSGVYVNLLIASELSWPQKGLRLTQTTKFPEEEGTTLTVHLQRPSTLALNIRIPYWADQGGSVRINGKPVEAFSNPSSYLALVREWKDGDRVEVRMPMRLHAEPIPGDETQQAVMYGPLVLAGLLGGEGLDQTNTMMGYDTSPAGSPAKVPEIPSASGNPAGWVEPVKGKALGFQAALQGRLIPIIPLYQVQGQRYVVYWKMNT